MKNKISILENKETENVECASCKSSMFDIKILEKQLEDATNNKSFEKPMYRRKVFHKISKLTGYKIKEPIEYG